jgi:hypothetical protein
MAECVSRDRLANALRSRSPDLWQENPRLAERIQMRIKAALRRHVDAHGGTIDASRCLSERYPVIEARRRPSL